MRARLAIFTAALLLAACTSSADQSVSVSSRADVARTVVVVAGGGRAKVTSPKLTVEHDAAMKDWGELPIAVGRPVEVALDVALPPEGLTITRTYEHPLPDDAAATIAYFDSTYGTWVAVASTVAADRKSVSAVVHHLSLWTDIVSFGQGAADAVKAGLASAADWGYYQVGMIFDVRVDAPTCDSGKPGWLDSVNTIEANRNNSILFCTGLDKNAPGLVVVKARVNRGFGFNATSPSASWTYNSTIDKKAMDEIVKTLTELDQVVAASFRDALANGNMVGPGEEVSLGLSEEQARAAPSGVAMRLDPQPVLPFLITVLGQLAMTDLSLKADGYVAAAMALAKCANDVKAATDFGSTTKALVSCLGSVDEAVAKQLATYLTKRGVKDAGKLAGRIIGKLVVALAIVGPVFNGMNYWAEQSPDLAAGRTATLFPKVTAKPKPAVLDPDSTGMCASPCTITGSVPLNHPAFGHVTLYTLQPNNPPAEATAVLVDQSGRIRWALPGNAEERTQYEFALAKPATDASGLYFINYNPGRYNGLTVLRPSATGMDVIAGWYNNPMGQDLYYARLDGIGSDGKYTVIKSENDCTPDCAGGLITEQRLKWDGTEFAP